MESHPQSSAFSPVEPSSPVLCPPPAAPRVSAVLPCPVPGQSRYGSSGESGAIRTIIQVNSQCDRDVAVSASPLPGPCPALARPLPGACPALARPLPLPAAARATLARSLDILGRLPGSLVIPVSGSSPDRNLCSKPNAGCACCYHADCHTRFSGES